MKKIKVFSTAALAAVAVTALASCGGNGGSSDKTITFYNTCGQNLQTVIQTAIDSFQEKYGWTVTSSQIGGYDEVYSTCIAGLTANDAPDIAYCYSDHVAAYIQSGKVVDMAKYINSKDTVKDNAGNTVNVGYSAEEVADFIPGYYNEGKAYNYANYDQYGYDKDSMLTMPFSKSTELLYYNAEALVEAGIVDDKGNAKVPTTWDEMWAACDILKAKFPAATPFCYDSEANWAINMCMQNGWNYTSASSPYFTFKDETRLASWLDTLTEKYEKGIIATQTTYGSYTSGLFTTGIYEKDSKGNPVKDASGKYSELGGCVFCIGSSGGASYQATDKFEWGVAAIPGTKQADGTINNSVISQGPSLCMFDSGNDEKTKMAWLFVKEILEPAFQADFSQTSGYNPVRSSVYNIDSYKTFLSDNSNIKAQAATVASTLQNWFYTSPAFKGSADARIYVGTALVEVVKGEQTGASALAKAYKNCGGK